MHNKSVIIVGGGIVGMSIGWELVQKGLEVTILDRGMLGQEASWYAGGMLAANAEVGFEELDFYRLSAESLERWPAYARALESSSSMSVNYRDDGSISVADDPDSAVALRRTFEFHQSEGLDVKWLTGVEATDLEPFLAPNLAAAVYSASDHQVDNRLVLSVLETLLDQSAANLEEYAEVKTISPHDEHPSVQTADGRTFSAGTIIIAAGAWSRGFEGISSEHLPAVRPVKGQILDLQVVEPFGLRHVIRGPHAYVIPKDEHRLAIGATEEDMGFDERVTAGGVYSLLEGAWEVVPGVYDLPLMDAYASLRPGSRDNDPIVGWSDAPGVYIASGHFRNGILLAPITAQEAALEIADGVESEWLTGFRPQRFQLSSTIQ